jgi:hypothetical protein
VKKGGRSIYLLRQLSSQPMAPNRSVSFFRNKEIKLTAAVRGTPNEGALKVRSHIFFGLVAVACLNVIARSSPLGRP